MKKLFAVSSLILASCSSEKSQGPTPIPPIPSTSPTTTIPFSRENPPKVIPRSYWYSGTLIHGCEFSFCEGDWITGIVRNNTESNQRIGIGVYKVLGISKKLLGISKKLHHYNYWTTSDTLILYANLPDCHYEVYLGQIDTDFDPNNSPTEDEIFIIATEVGNLNSVCL